MASSADYPDAHVTTWSAGRNASPWDDYSRTLAEFIGHDTYLVEWPAHDEQIERAATRDAS